MVVDAVEMRVGPRRPRSLRTKMLDHDGMTPTDDILKAP